MNSVVQHTTTAPPAAETRAVSPLGEAAKDLPCHATGARAARTYFSTGADDVRAQWDLSRALVQVRAWAVWRIKPVRRWAGPDSSDTGRHHASVGCSCRTVAQHPAQSVSSRCAGPGDTASRPPGHQAITAVVDHHFNRRVTSAPAPRHRAFRPYRTPLFTRATHEVTWPSGFTSSAPIR